MFSSEKGKLKAMLEKTIIPSSVVGSDFTEIFAIRFMSQHEFTFQFSGSLELSFEVSRTGSRNDRVTMIDLKGEYALKKWLSLNFGFATSGRWSDVAQYEFNQFRLFFGVSGKY